MEPIYLDNNATTPVDERVADVAHHYSLKEYGNAGSRTHSWGMEAAKVTQEARRQISQSIASKPEDIIFTSGATEANNLAILGIAEHAAATGRTHIITTAIEHKAVLEPCEVLEKRGFEITVLPVGDNGWPAPSALEAALRPETVLISTMHANNETGVELPLDKYAEVLQGHEAWWHVDAAQTYGKRNETLRNSRIDMISISGHKVFAPKGIGALVHRRRGYQRAPLMPLMFGGGQERGLRPGTLPVALIAALGLAAELADKEADKRRLACEQFRQQVLGFLDGLGALVNGDLENMLPHVINASIRGVDAEAAIVMTKDLVAISNGSACTSESYEPSHVLTAMGLEQDRIAGALRISWNHMTEIPDWSALASRLGSLSQ
jgi:cysteine desulfurase